MIDADRTGLRRPDIQGLRALAVLAVCVFHVDKALLPGGFTGVDVFFVLSGFLMTSILLEQSRAGTGTAELAAERWTGIWAGNIWRFYRARALRIVPAYVAMLAVTTLAAAVLMIPADMVFFLNSLKSAGYFGSNRHFATFGDYFAPQVYEMPLLHSWSLAVEMQFYLLLPLAILLLGRRRVWLAAVLVLMGGTAAVAAWLAFGSGGRAAYFSTLARLPEFAAGGLVAAAPALHHLAGRFATATSLAGAGMIAAGFVLLGETTPFPGVAALLPALGTALVLAAQTGPVNRALSVRPLQWIGALSYSLYLWHWPVLALLRYHAGTYKLGPSHLVLFGVATLVLSLASYRLIEQPLRGPVTRTRLALAVGLCGLALALGSVATAFNNRLAPLLPVEQTRYAVYETICHGAIVGDCRRGDLGASEETLVIGDSHAAQLNLLFDDLGKASGSAFKVISASACLPLEGLDLQQIPDYVRESCAAQIARIKAELPGARRVVLAGKWFWQTGHASVLPALTTFLAQMQDAGKRVVVLAQVPMLATNAARLARFHSLGLPVDAKLLPAQQQANARVALVVQAFPSALFLDLTALPMFASPPLVDGVLVYFDQHHLNEVGVRMYGLQGRERLLRALGH